jgi:lysophospholipase L1-like esterase
LEVTVRSVACVFLASAGLAAAAHAADRPWQALTSPSIREVAERLESPPPQYGLTFYWGWDGPVNEEVIARDLDTFRALGVRTVTLEPGYEMPSPYLSEGWFELVRLAVEQARRRGMHVWLVDEGKYPSGFAGGRFSSERPDLRMQALLVAERVKLKGGETLARSLPPGTVGAVAVEAATQVHRVLPVRHGSLRWTAPSGDWEVLLVEHQFRTAQTRSVNDPSRAKTEANSLCDYLNPAATRQFIEFTHAQYEKHVGAEFGRTILGFRGDEPDFARVPWTPSLPDEFRKRKGYDVLPYLASLFVPRPAERERRAKADYWDVWSDLFRENFFRVQADWCASRGLEYLVHLNHEDQMPALVRSEGDFFKDMRYVQVPGVDAIWNQIWPGKTADFPKYASSAAHLFGRPRAFTESFAAYRTAPDVRQARWVLNQQLVRGINMVELMFVPASSSGKSGLDGWLASAEFPAVAAYVNRAAFLLAQGRPAARIALYHPTSSLWLGDEDANRSTLAVAQLLLEQQRDFDFVDEQTLSSLLTLEGGILRNRSGQGYEAVILPRTTAISRAALDRLRAFARAGGRVIALGPGPSLIVDRTLLAAQAAPHLPFVVREETGELAERVLKALPPPDVVLDPPNPAVKYNHRRWSDSDLYFFFNESEEPRSATVTLEGSGAAQLWDASEGTIANVDAETTNAGHVRLRLDLAPHETRFVVLGASRLPRLFLIGDSTVRNGKGDGANGQWGWGEPIAIEFDRTRIEVVNRAIGGRSSRTFQTEGRWDQVESELAPGDFVILQFGHNDGGELFKGNRPRASLPGTGEETAEGTVELTGKAEQVHTYGWYLRQYVTRARARGATPIVCSPVPRKIWKDGRIARASEDYGRWAAEVARSAGVPFVDLNEIVARRYDALGPDRVESLFADEHTHTNAAGARLNAASVIEGLKALRSCELCSYLSAAARDARSTTDRD